MTTLNTIIEEEVVEAFDAFLDQYTGKHEKDNWLKNTLYADTVQVRKDLIVKQFREVLATAMQRAYEAGRAEERERIKEWAGRNCWTEDDAITDLPEEHQWNVDYHELLDALSKQL